GNRARVVRTRQRYERVQKLKAEGMRIAAIQRELRLAPGTARRYFHATSADELVAGTLAGWPSMLDDHKPYLHQRWNEGCTNIQQLHNEVKALGFRVATAPSTPISGPSRARRLRRPSPPRPRSVTSPAGSAAAPTTSTTASSLSSRRYGPPAPTWTLCAATSRSSPR